MPRKPLTRQQLDRMESVVSTLESEVAGRQRRVVERASRLFSIALELDDEAADALVCIARGLFRSRGLVRGGGQ